MESSRIFDVVVVGGGPAGATAAHDLARAGKSVALLDRDGRTKPCGGAVPPKLIEEFSIPESLLVARAKGARIIAPSRRRVDMPIQGGYVGMVDREVFDEWLRERARQAGAERVTGAFQSIHRDADGGVTIDYQPRHGATSGHAGQLRARCVVGADGAASVVARDYVPGGDELNYVYAYHEIIRSPRLTVENGYDATRCDIYYDGKLSPDFYAWIFPHGETASVGTGTAQKGRSLRSDVSALRKIAGLEHAETLRREGAPIPMKPLKRWDDGRNIVLAGDAAGVVAPASGEGIYYAMAGGRWAADAAAEFLRTGDVRALQIARKRFMRAHGRVFFILGIMQHFWYSSDKRRERFVTLCADPDVARLTWEAYMHKKLVRADPLAHARIFFKDLAHLLGLVRA